MEETKYFQIDGPSEIRIRANGDVELYFYDDENNAIINPDKPFVFDVKSNERLRFVSSVLIVGMSQPAYDENVEALGGLAPGITWEGADAPANMRKALMNPIKHPPGG